MTPSPTVAPAAPFAVVSTAVHDREWWVEEAVRAGTDWSGLIAAALEQPESKTMTTWDGASWRASAKDYHEQRASRRISETIRPERLAHQRRLMADEMSIDRAWHELRGSRQSKFSNIGISR